MTYERRADQAEQASSISLEKRQVAAAETEREERLCQEKGRERRSGIIRDKVAERIDKIGGAIDCSINSGIQGATVHFYARYPNPSDELIEDEANSLTGNFFTELGYTVAIKAEQGSDHGQSMYVDPDVPVGGFPAYVTTFDINWE